ncbi:MAG: nucleotide exchange factor GrpE [Azospirillaceae bacterium]|nr:nucleotide exchange factor GrpE [Azospirillaceae bacterium]
MTDPQNNPSSVEAQSAAASDAAPDEAAREPSATPTPAESDARIAELEAKVAELRDQTLRALADAENTRRRAQREREDTAKYAVVSFAKELVTVADNLRRALDAVPADQRDANDLIKTLVVGIEATERQLIAAFDRVGIVRQEPLGEPFDPNFHQVMFEIEDAGKAPGTVVQVMQPGYKIHDRLLREALVGVAKRPSGEAPVRQVDTTA